MAGDRARVSYDPSRKWRGLIAQQGRVTVEADWNEAAAISAEHDRQLTLEVVGTVGTPDGGYVVTAVPAAGSPPAAPESPPGAAPGDLVVGAGTVYLGGERLDLTAPVSYSAQPDWLDFSTDPLWVPPAVPAAAGPSYELVYLLASEQEVSAVEDPALADVALGGPDTMARQRILQRFLRQPSQSASCYEAWNGLVDSLGSAGLRFDAASMRIESTATLQVSFASSGPAGPCQPAATGGYLGAENQMIRVMVASVDASGVPTIVWGFDDASFLYRVQAAAFDPSSADTTLTLASAPADSYHFPARGQAVELLRDAVQLTAEDFIASPNGFVSTLAAGYAPASRTLAISGEPPADYLSPATPQLYLRVWQATTAAPPGQATPLGDTGVAITLSSSTGSFHAGDFWRFALRPIQPAIVYPARYLAAPQPPDGPRTWGCPLAVLAWEGGSATATSCVPLFSGLTGRTASQGGCCTVDVGPSDVHDGASLQALLALYATRGPITVCLEPGTYTLSAPLVLGSQFNGITLQACREGAVLQAPSQPGAEFTLGLIVLQGVSSATIRGLELSVPLTGFSPPAGSFSALPEQNQVLLGAFSTGLQVAIGISVDNSTGLTIEDCRFGLGSPGQTNVFGAGIFATGAMEGTTITGCTFECASPPATVPFNELAVTQVVNGQLGVSSPYQLTFGYLQVPGASASSSTSTTTFGTPGSYSFTVPAGVTSLALAATGAAGGSSTAGAANNGQGAAVSATVPVPAGSQLSVEVGAAGSGVVGGAGGGGAGGAAAASGAGGGGASVVSVTSPAPGATPLLVAGGGGGAGGAAASGTGGPGAAGNAGSAGVAGSAGIGGGEPGTSNAGGSGGAAGFGGGTGGTAGTSGVGGAGGSGGPVGGGGGGGGYYGGGGGGGGGNGTVGGGGGGGSSFVAAGASGVSGPTPTAAAAQVTITYAVQQESAQLLHDAAIAGNLFRGLTVPVLAMAQLGTLRVDRNTVRSAYGGFWLVSLTNPGQQNVIFGQFPVGDPNLYSEFASSGIAALRDGIFTLATAIGQVLPAVPPGGGLAVPGAIPAPTTAQVALTAQTLATFYARASGPSSGPALLPSVISTALTNLGVQAAAAGALPAADPGTSVTLRLDLSDCQVDAIIASSYSGAGLVVADFTTDAGSALLHGNRIRSRFPMGGAAVVGGVSQAGVTGNIVANEVAPEVTFAGASSAAMLPSYSMVLNPATTPLGGVLDPSGALFGDVAGVAAVAVTGNVFIDPTSLPPRPATIPAALADWDVLNTVINYGLAAPPTVTGVSPANGPADAQVMVTGSGFTGATAVGFGGVAAAFSPGSTDPDGELIVTVPAGSGTVNVTVTTPAGTSPVVTQDQFTYLAVTGVVPPSGQPPLPVTIFGSGFTGATQVNFGRVAVSGVVVAGQGGQIEVTLPAGSGTVDVTVSTPAGVSATVPADQFTYLHVSSVAPSPSGFAPSPQVTVNGGGFTPDSTVIFTAVAGAPSPVLGTNVTFVNSTTLQVNFPGQANSVPGGAGYTVTVRTPYGTSAPGPTTFTYSGSTHF